MQPLDASQTTALVLSGGGARGAYEAGVVAGIIDVLGLDAPPFRMFAGTSVGAINASFLAGHTHRADLDVHRLLDLWRSLRLKTHLRMHLRPRRRGSLLDVRPFEDLVQDSIDWRRFRTLVDEGTLSALFIAALDVESGRTTIFADVAKSVDWRPSRDPQRVPRQTHIGPEHVLASAAIPGVFPPRRIGHHLYYDGGLRFNTPISPVLRAGAKRLVVISPLHQASPVIGTTTSRPPADPLFLMGKMVHAMLLDPFAYDLQVLERFNQLLDVLNDTMDREERARFHQRCVETRGAPYRRIKTLVFSPSKDLGHLGLEFIRTNRRRLLRNGILAAGISLAAKRIVRTESDLLSYLLFDGAFTAQLIELGRQDAIARQDDLHRFFHDDPVDGATS